MNAPAQLRIAVDAANLACDRRGMGRLARATLHAALARTDVAVTLLVAARREAALVRAEFPACALRPPATARARGYYYVVWYPFNGMRFTSAAPTLVTLHDVFAFSEAHPRRIARYREQQPIRRAARHATRIVTDSAWSRAQIVRELGVAAERIAVVRPEPEPYWCPAHGDALPQPLRPDTYALLVGAREARKNARLALQACAAALHGPDESLVIAGDLPPEARAYARSLGLRAGEISASDGVLRALYRNARVVLVPSLAEGYGLVAAEALACGAAVIASNAAALPEAAGDGAVLLDPYDAPGWTREIRALFDDGARVAALRARALARFAGVDRAAPQRHMLTLLRELARGAGT